MNVLVTAAGTGSAVAVITALKEQSEIPVRIVAVDVEPDSAGLFLADDFAVVPRSDDPSFYDALLEICRRYEVDVVLPTHSTEIKLFASWASNLERDGIKTALPRPEIVELSDDKVKMDQAVREMGVRTPRPVTGSLEVDGPYFARLRHSSGSRSARVVSSPDELEIVNKSDHEFQLSELITGTEYTVDLLARRDSSLAVCSPRERQEVRSGQTVCGITCEMPEIVEIVQRICTVIGYVGPANMQFIVDDAGPVFIELNPRFAAGGLGLTIAAGGNIPLMTFKLALGYEIETANVMSGIRLVRYYRDLIIRPEDEN